MKRDKRDVVFSNLVRRRAGWKCERCGKAYVEGSAQGLDCSHFYGRRHRSTRWHPDNAFAHCRGCHQYLGSNPAIFAEWVKDQLGETRYDWLRYRHNLVMKYTKADLEDLYKHLKQQWDDGILEFESYD